MKELENLLNTLIKMGWKPWGKGAIKMSKQCPDRETGVIYIHFTGEERGYRHIRQLVSLESQLWQFVCDKQLHKHDQRTDSDWIKNIEDTRDSEKSIAKYLTESDFRYRLIESALVPEEELEKFLVDNIIVGGK